MKTIINKLPILLILFVFQFCKSQNKERYVSDYNKAVPKLQQVATSKQKYYGKYFSEFMSQLELNGVKIKIFFYKEKGLSPKINMIILEFVDSDDFGIDDNYQHPRILITFQEQIPDEIRQLTLKSHGELTQEVKDFLADRKIENIVFYGINGLTSKDRSAR